MQGEIIAALESGLEYARECLSEREVALGRSTPANQRRCEAMEADIRQMEQLIAKLREQKV